MGAIKFVFSKILNFTYVCCVITILVLFIRLTIKNVPGPNPDFSLRPIWDFKEVKPTVKIEYDIEMSDENLSSQMVNENIIVNSNRKLKEEVFQEQKLEPDLIEIKIEEDSMHNEESDVVIYHPPDFQIFEINQTNVHFIMGVVEANLTVLFLALHIKKKDILTDKNS